LRDFSISNLALRHFGLLESGFKDKLDKKLCIQDFYLLFWKCICVIDVDINCHFGRSVAAYPNAGRKPTPLLCAESGERGRHPKAISSIKPSLFHLFT
jgi:hypothetical protein